MTTRTWRHRLRRAWAGEQGTVSVELAIAVPVLLLMLLAIVQFAVWSHATHIAQSAASHGLAAARVDGGTSSAGHDATNALLAQLGDGPLRDVTVSVRRGDVTARVRVVGTAEPVIPFLSLPVTAEATGVVEKVPAP